jgi:hypothetical protein
MPARAELLGEELHRLKKGRGLQDPDVLDDLGPGITAALELDLRQTADDRRQALRRGLYDAAEHLIPELRDVFRIAFAIHPESPATLEARLAHAAARFRCSGRTVRRRLDEAVPLVAERLASRESSSPYAQRDWETRGLRAVLHLDGGRPVLTERRLIVATAAELSSLDHRISLPAPPGRDSALPTLVADHGCTVGATERQSASHWHYRIDLSRPLRLYEEHLYSLTCTLPSLGDLRPYYVLVPFNGGCRSFSAEVHFGTPPVASVAWRVDGVPLSVLDDEEPTADRFDLAADPVAACSFADIRPGLCYGVQWRWREAVLAPPG